MTISKEAIEAAGEIIELHVPLGMGKQLAEAALTAALPFLALRPAPSQSDDAIVESILIGLPDSFAYKGYVSGDIHNALATVRAEERERAAKWHDDRARQTPDVFEQEFHEVSASAIRAGVTADEWVALSTRKP